VIYSVDGANSLHFSLNKKTHGQNFPKGPSDNPASGKCKLPSRVWDKEPIANVLSGILKSKMARDGDIFDYFKAFFQFRQIGRMGKG